MLNLTSPLLTGFVCMVDSNVIISQLNNNYFLDPMTGQILWTFLNSIKQPLSKIWSTRFMLRKKNLVFQGC